MLSWRSSSRVGNPTPLPAWSSRVFFVHDDGPGPDIIADALLHFQDTWQLPRIATWNVRSLFHAGSLLAEKLGTLNKLLAHSDVLGLQETHARSLDDYEAIGYLRHFRVFHSPCAHAASGGVAVLFRKSLLSECELEVRELAPGRALAIEVTKGHHQRFFLTVHLSPSEAATWQELALLCSNYVEEHRHWIGFLFGDFNVCLAPEDVLNIDTLQPVGLPGARAHHYHACFGHLAEIMVGPTRKGNDNLVSALDRVLTTIKPAFLDLLDVTARTWGLPWDPPAGSDHCPVLVSVQHKTNNDGFPRWTVSTPDWPKIFKHQLALRLVPGDPWQQRYHQLRDAIAATAAEIQSLRRDAPVQGAEAQFAIGLRALHACWAHQPLAAHRLAGLAGLVRPPRHLARLLDRLANHLHELRAQVWEEHLAAHPLDEHQSSSPKAIFTSKLFALWKMGRRLPDPCILDSDSEPIGPSPLEAAALAEHWSGVFDVIDVSEEVDLTDYLPYIQPLDWSQLTFDVEEASEMIKHSPPSRGGPDDMDYKMFKHCPEALASVAVEAYQEACVTGSLHASLLSSHTIFIPKAPVLGAFPADLRPITLNNIVAKVVPAILSSKALRLAPSWCHHAQHGCGQSRSTATALGQLESHLWRHNRLHSHMAALFCDIKAAFPSLRRSWLKAVLCASGCPSHLLKLFDAHLAPSFTWVVWKNDVHSGFHIRQGVKQGCPLSGFLFLLGVDCWIRMFVSQMPPRMSLVAYYDDFCFLVADYDEAMLAFRMLSRLEVAAGLRVNFKKTLLVPLGSCELDTWRVDWHVYLGREHPLCMFEVQIVPATRYLGFWVGRGRLDPFCLALSKLQARIPLIKSLSVGLAHNLVLARSVAFSVMHHSLSSFSPSPSLDKVWSQIEQSLVSGPRSWLGLAIHRLRSLFKWPAPIPQLEVVAATLSLRQLSRLPFDLDAALAAIETEHSRPSSLLCDPAPSWYSLGAFATWRKARMLGRELDLIKRQRIVRSGQHRISLKFALGKVTATISAHFLPSLRDVEFDLFKRFCSKYGGEPLVARYLRPGFFRLLLLAIKQVATKVSPQSSVALARIAFGGLLHRSAPPHFGNCPFLLEHHTGSLYSCVSRGCFRIPFAQHGPFRWLRDTPPTILFDLVSTLSGPSFPETLKRIAGVSRLFVAVIHEVFSCSPRFFCRCAACSGGSASRTDSKAALMISRFALLPCKNDSRPAIRGIVRFAIRDSVPLGFRRRGPPLCQVVCNNFWSFEEDRSCTPKVYSNNVGGLTLCWT